MNRDQRLSHDALYNIYELAFQLKFTNHKGDIKEFITHITLHPRIIVHLMASPLLDSLQYLLNINSLPVTLHYDTVFNMGDYYMSTLTYRHYLFNGNPIIPCAFMIHSRRFHDDHKIFLQSITEAVASLVTKKVNIITDQEFKFSDLFPSGSHLFCWNHLLNDLRWHARHRCSSTADEVNYYVNVFRRLMNNGITEIDFDREWETVKLSFKSKRKIYDYFEKKLIPTFKKHASIWTLRKAGILNPENGITNNPSESMNSVFHRIQQWKQIPLDVIATSMYHLCAFYYREIQRSLHQCGRWKIKDEYDYLKCDPSLLPRFQSVIDPKDIIDQVHIDTHVKASVVSKSTVHQQDSCGSSQVGLAHAAIKDDRVKLVGNGAFVVTETDGSTLRAVKIFPRETCTCSSTKTCYHISACKLVVGLTPSLDGKPSLSDLRRKERIKMERPSGRRKHDFQDVNGTYS